MKTLSEMIAVMQAALDGKPIQFKKTTLHNCWWDVSPGSRILWDWAFTDYRVKPDILDSRSEDSIEFLELTPEVKQKLGMPA